jgi:competence protein ComEC
MSAGVLAEHAPREDALRARAANSLGGVAAAQQGRLALWCPAALAAGIGLYFALPGEPALALAVVLAVLGLCCAWAGRGRVPVLILAGVAALGFSLAKFRADMVAGPLLSATTGEVAVAGRVIAVDRASGGRLAMVLAPTAIEGLPAEKLPRRVRLSLPERAGHPDPGTELAFKARLAPLPAPVMPGGFDYGRKLWFEGIGATGRVTPPLTVTGSGAGPGEWLDVRLSRLRALMGARIHAALEEPYASFAEALITGERSTIPPEVNRSLQISGLYHILSISGLHMWLVAGGVFWAVRAVLALAPGLALVWPIKKWAAAAAVMTGLFYLLLADSGVATERSFIMVAVVFFAVIADRPALSARNLAVAALVILLREPEAAVDASFQMSFLAVLGLVAVYEAWARHAARRRVQEVRPRHWVVRVGAWAITALALSLLTSLVAGAASSLPAAYHFGRLSPYGVLANGLAIPVVGLVVMPAALLSAMLMPLGLEWLPLGVMAQGLSLVTLISDGIAALPGADAIMARPSASAIVLMGVGFVWLALIAGTARLAGLPVLALGAVMALTPPAMPDLLVSRAGENVALLSAGGALVPAHARRARFSVEKWLAANGEEKSPAEAARQPGWDCHENRCRAVVKDKSVLYVSRSEGLPLDCAGVDILIADFPLRGACRGVPLRVDRFDLWRSGAHALHIGAEGVTVTTARAEQGARPWVVRPEARARAFTPRSPEDDRPLD